MSDTSQVSRETSQPESSELDTFASATEMLAALRAGRVSSVELLEMHLHQIEKYNPTLNAIVYPNFDQARRTAQAADAARARGENEALLGLPLTIKDCLYVEGLPSTMGVTEFAQFRPPADGVLAGRVRAAGAVIMGKTNIPPYAGDWQANNPVYGRSNNPWDLERTPGGSTGGGAAALAAGMTALEFGSDIGGSIRVPAAFCGVFGHRPSESALARSGHLPGTALPNPAVVMAVQGPLARTAEDLELAFDVVSGPEIGEEVAWKLQLPPARHQKLAEYRVAVMPWLDWLPVDHKIRAKMENLAENLNKAGATVKTTMPDGFGDFKEYHKVYRSMLSVIMALDMPVELRRQQAQKLQSSGDEFLIAEAAGYEASAGDFIGWHGQREGFRAAFRAFFKEWDILLAPITLIPAFRHDTRPFGERTIEVNGQTVPYMMQIVYPSLTTLAGQPATAFPVGLSQEGLPLGLQAVGPYLEDYTTLRFAAMLTREFGGFQAPPGYGAKK